MAVAQTTGASGYTVKVDEKTGRLKMPPTMNGINIGNIIEGFEKAEEAKLIRPQEKLDKLDERAKALGDVQEKTAAFHKAANLLQGADFTGTSSGVFGITKATLQSHNGQPGFNYFDMLPGFGKPPTDLTFDVQRLATKDNLISSTAIVDRNSALNLAATVNFTTGGIETSVTINATDSAFNIRDKINAVSQQSGVEVELIPSGNDYKFVLKSNNDAQPLTFSTTVTAGDASILPLANTASVPDATTAANLDATLSFAHVNTLNPNVDITLLTSDTPEDIRDKINAQSANTNVAAEIVTLDGNDYLRFNKVDNTIAASFTKTINSGDASLIPDSVATNAEGLKAQVSYRGEVSTYDSNQVKIAGHTFQLYQTTTGPVNVRTDYDRAQTYSALQDWVETYNEALETIKSYTQVKDDFQELGSEETPLLGRNPLTIEIETFLSQTLIQPVPGLHNTSLNSLESIGIKRGDDGKLELDGIILNDALQNNYDRVKNVFVFNYSSTNPNHKISGHPEKIDPVLTQYNTPASAPNTITLNVSKDVSGNLSATLTDAISGEVLNVSLTTPNPFDSITPHTNISENDDIISVTVRDPGKFNGFKFMINEPLANGASTTSDFTLSQGLGDKMIKFSNRLLTLEGQIDLGRAKTEFQLATDTIKEDIDEQQERIDRIKEKSARKMARLERDFEALSKVLASVQSIRASLQAIDNIATAASA